MYRAAALAVGIYDTTDPGQRGMLDSMLALNGTSIDVQSVHTAGSVSSSDVERILYHWVTVVYRRINE